MVFDVEKADSSANVFDSAGKHRYAEAAQLRHFARQLIGQSKP